MSNIPGSYPNLMYPGKRTPMGIKNYVPEPMSSSKEQAALVAINKIDSIVDFPLDLGPGTYDLSDYDFSWRELPYGKEWDASRIKKLSDHWVSIK